MLPEPEHSVLVGSLLGDACLSRNGRLYRVRFDHSASSTEYALWKHSLLRRLCYEPRAVAVFDKRTRNHYHHIRFDTKSLAELEWYANTFYPTGRKVVPLCVESLLSELALAVWYMDDGHRRTDCNALRLNTHGFSCSDVEQLANALSNRYSVRSKLHRAGNDQWVLYIPSRSAVSFCEIIRPYVPPCMGYKLL
jgi:hypothetical protein